jgi:hypothetical protein
MNKRRLGALVPKTAAQADARAIKENPLCH